MRLTCGLPCRCLRCRYGCVDVRLFDLFPGLIDVPDLFVLGFLQARVSDHWMLNESLVLRRILLLLLAVSRRRIRRRRISRVSCRRCRGSCQACAPGQRFRLGNDHVARRRRSRESTPKVLPSSCTKSVFLNVLRCSSRVVAPRAMPSILGSDFRASRGSVESRPNSCAHSRSPQVF